MNTIFSSSVSGFMGSSSFRGSFPGFVFDDSKLLGCCFKFEMGCFNDSLELDLTAPKIGEGSYVGLRGTWLISATSPPLGRGAQTFSVLTTRWATFLPVGGGLEPTRDDACRTNRIMGPLSLRHFVTIVPGCKHRTGLFNMRWSERKVCWNSTYWGNLQIYVNE